MTHAEVLEQIAAAERRLADLQARRDPARLRPLVRKAQAEAEVLEKRLDLGPAHDQPAPRWVPLALLALPVGLVAWLALLSLVLR